jgi:site-specific DNA-methyltransferase (adenine-specific)
MRKPHKQIEMKLNTIYNENCLDTMKRMPNNFVDIVVTSPPYNIGKNRTNGNFEKKQYKTYSDDLTKEEYFNQTKDWINELLRVTKYHIFWNVQELKGNKGISQFIMKEFADNLKETFIWVKTNPNPTCLEGLICNSYEYIFCLSNDRPDSKMFTYHNFNKKMIKNVIEKPVNNGASKKEEGGHGYAFGEWLPNFFINKFTKEGDTIYDCFMGSGTTAKSAHLYNRNWIGSEISKEYVDIANKRLKPYLMQTKLF